MASLFESHIVTLQGAHARVCMTIYLEGQAVAAALTKIGLRNTPWDSKGYLPGERTCPEWLAGFLAYTRLGSGVIIIK